MFKPHRSPRSLLVCQLRLLVLAVLLLSLPLTSQLPIAAATVPASVQSGPDMMLDQPETFVPVAQQGDDETLVSTTTPITPTATLEEPAPEVAENRVYLPLVQGQPGEDTNASVDPELTAAIEQALRDDPDSPSVMTILVSNVKQSGDWAFGNVAIPAAEADASPRAFLFLAQLNNTTWEVTFEAEATFQEWLPLIPETLMSEAERAILTVEPALAGNGSGQLGLPWAAGETWVLTGGPHSAAGSAARSAIDFAGGSGNIRAARDGVAYTYASCPNFIRIAHGGGWTTTYYHVANIAVRNGQSVSRGTYLGRTSAQVGCGGSATGAHVHFALEVNSVPYAVHGVDIGGWTVENGAAAYAGCMVRVKDGVRRCASQGQIYNDGSVGTGTASGEVVCDNLSACFSKYESSGSWGYVQPGRGDSSTAYSQHAYWTYNTQNRALDWGKWQPSLPSSGTYDVYVWYPKATTTPAATGSATYQVHHANGDTNVTLNQGTNPGAWNKLARVRCNTGSSCYVKLTDRSPEGTNTRRIWLDAVKFVLVSTP